jgi:hypothetical protein
MTLFGVVEECDSGASLVRDYAGRLLNLSSARGLPLGEAVAIEVDGPKPWQARRLGGKEALDVKAKMQQGEGL